MPRTEIPTYLFSLLLLTLTSCDRRLSIGSFERDGSGSNGGGSRGDANAGEPNDGSSTADDAGSTCNSKGPVLRVGDGFGPTCPGGLASRQFRYAMCTCEELVSSAGLMVDAFGVGVQSGLSDGSVGVNGSLYPLGGSVAGSLVVAGADGIVIGAGLTVGADLRDQGQLDGQFDVRVEGDVEVGGDVRVKSLTLGGKLSVGAASTVEVTDGNPAFTQGSVAISPPCDCARGPDIAALIEDAKGKNDNTRAGIVPADALRALDAALDVTFPCGRYYVDTIYAPNPITITAEGRVALYVGGDVVTEVGGRLRVQLASGAELDLVIEGNVSADDLVVFGSSDTPGRVRVYAGGTTLSLAGGASLGGTLYAPTAELVSSSTFEAWGAVFVRRVTGSGDVTLHYDRGLTAPACP